AAASALLALPAPPVPLGVWEEVSEGEDVLILAVGRMVESAQKVASNLATEGISCGVINARWVKPLDRRLEQWAERYRKVVTLEDNVVAGGFGGAVLEQLAGLGVASKVSVLGLPDRFLPAGSVDDLLHDVGLDPESITARVAILVNGAD
ncbi:MAG: transketolase C-terminal domain-containing protein, partial [Acidimicrobiia bacterium]